MELPLRPFTCQSRITQGYNPKTHVGLDEVPYDAYGTSFPAFVRATLSGRINTNNTYNPNNGNLHQITIDSVIEDDAFIAYLKSQGVVPKAYVRKVVLKHSYLHGLQILVMSGDVTRGQNIMICGNTGDVWSGGKPVPQSLKGKSPYPGLHLHRQYYLYDDKGNKFNIDDQTNPQGTIHPSIIDNYNPMKTIGFKQAGNDTVYIEVGSLLVPLADWEAFVTLGGSTESVIELPPDQFAKFNLGTGTLFKSINN